MTQIEDSFYREVQRRIKIFIAVFGIGGAIGATLWKGVATGGGFLVGAAVSFLSYWRWEQIVSSLGGQAKGGSSFWWMLRSLVLVAIAYVIIRFFGLNLPAALVGLLVSAAAVVLELIYEIIYART